MIVNPRLILPHSFSRLYHDISNTDSFSSALNGFIKLTYIVNQLGVDLYEFVGNHLHNTPPILVEEVEGRVIQDLKISLVSPFCHFLPVGIHYLLL